MAGCKIIWWYDHSFTVDVQVGPLRSEYDRVVRWQADILSWMIVGRNELRMGGRPEWVVPGL